MNRKIRFWLDWVFLAVIALWALTLAVHSRRETPPDNIVRRSVLILSSPILKATQAAAGRMHSLFYSVLYGPVTYNEIQEYQNHIRRLQIMVAHQNETVRRLQRLSRIETKSLQEDYRLVLAQVIGRGRDTYTEGLRISMGELDGLQVGLPVVHENATVVGYIREVNATDSHIQLLSDPNSLIACAIENTNESGVVRGLGAQADHLEFLPRVQTSTLSEGARLVTSGLTGSLFPGGLRIGEILRIEPNDAGERVGQVRPGVQFSNLEEVVVLLPRHGPIRPMHLHWDDDDDELTIESPIGTDHITIEAIDIPIPEEITPPTPPTPAPTPSPTLATPTPQPVATLMPRPATSIVTPRVAPAQPVRTPPAANQSQDTTARPGGQPPSPPAGDTAGTGARTSPSAAPSYLQQLLTPPGDGAAPEIGAADSPSGTGSVAPHPTPSDRIALGVFEAGDMPTPIIQFNEEPRPPVVPDAAPSATDTARYIFD